MSAILPDRSADHGWAPHVEAPFLMRHLLIMDRETSRLTASLWGVQWCLSMVVHRQRPCTFVPVLLRMGLGFLTRSRYETMMRPTLGNRSAFRFRIQKTSRRLQSHSWLRRGLAADTVAPVSPACLGTNERRRRVAPRLALSLAPATPFLFLFMFLISEHSTLSTCSRIAT